MTCGDWTAQCTDPNKLEKMPDTTPAAPGSGSLNLQQFFNANCCKIHTQTCLEYAKTSLQKGRESMNQFCSPTLPAGDARFFDFKKEGTLLAYVKRVSTGTTNTFRAFKDANFNNAIDDVYVRSNCCTPATEKTCADWARTKNCGEDLAKCLSDPIHHTCGTGRSVNNSRIVPADAYYLGKKRNLELTTWNEKCCMNNFKCSNWDGQASSSISREVIKTVILSILSMFVF